MLGLSAGWQSVKKPSKAAWNFGLSLVGLLDLVGQRRGQFGHALLELLDGLLEVLDLRLGVGEELVEQVGELLRRRSGRSAQRFCAVLEQDRAAGVLEDDVAERIALVDLLGDFGVEVVVGVLGLPVAALAG